MHVSARPKAPTTPSLQSSTFASRGPSAGEQQNQSTKDVRYEQSYALVWNATQGCWQVASELTRRRGKAGRGRVLMTAGASLIGLAFAGLAHALPTGGAVVDGRGTIQAEGHQ